MPRPQRELLLEIPADDGLLESPSVFSGPGFTTPSKTTPHVRDVARAMKPSSRGEWVAWTEVESFLRMAEQAMSLKKRANERLEEQLDQARAELARARKAMSQVEQQESRAFEESNFLADQVHQLLTEKQLLKQQVQMLQQERQALAEENELLRGECNELHEVGASEPEETTASMAHALARQQAELERVAARGVCLENDNVQLKARCTALEAALKAQQASLVSCLEESERSRLQHLALHIPESPRGHSEWCLRRSHGTDEGASTSYCSALEEEGSLASCVTPAGSLLSSRALTASPSAAARLRDETGMPSQLEATEQAPRKHQQQEPCAAQMQSL